MGSMGAFVNVDIGNFAFVDGGKTFNSIGEVDGIKVLVRPEGYSVKAPEYSHTENRIYAIVQGDRLKHLTFYGDDHKQIVSIDVSQKHHGVIPHKHYNLNHNDSGIPINESEQKLINKIKRRFNLK